MCPVISSSLSPILSFILKNSKESKEHSWFSILDSSNLLLQKARPISLSLSPTKQHVCVLRKLSRGSTSDKDHSGEKSPEQKLEINGSIKACFRRVRLMLSDAEFNDAPQTPRHKGTLPQPT